MLQWIAMGLMAYLLCFSILFVISYLMLIVALDVLCVMIFVNTTNGFKFLRGPQDQTWSVGSKLEK